MAGQRPESAVGLGGTDLSGRTVLVTGSTSGVGREAALALGRMGAEVLVHGRDERRGRQVVEEIAATAADGAAFFAADYADLQSVREFAEAVADHTDELDVLANNAGGYFPDGGTTAQGVEYTFGVNHLAPFVLTADLLPLVEAAGGRVVTTSSVAHRQGSMDFEALARPTTGTGWSAYGRSKLANVLFTRELARRLDAADSDVTANCFHPGAIPGSGFVRNAPFPVPLLSTALDSLPSALTRPFVDTPVDGAGELVYLAASRDVDGVSGEYFSNQRRRTPSRAARDDGTARRLWAESEALAGVEYGLAEG